MKLKSICVLLILACGSLLASPRKMPCPDREAAAARMIKAKDAGTAMAADADLLPIHRFSATVL